MSRLDYGPKLKEIQVTDIKKGIGIFTPKPDKPVSFAALKETLKKAGYTLDSAEIIVTGPFENFPALHRVNNEHAPLSCCIIPLNKYGRLLQWAAYDQAT